MGESFGPRSSIQSTEFDRQLITVATKLLPSKVRDTVTSEAPRSDEDAMSALRAPAALMTRPPRPTRARVVTKAMASEGRPTPRGRAPVVPNPRRSANVPGPDYVPARIPTMLNNTLIPARTARGSTTTAPMP